MQNRFEEVIKDQIREFKETQSAIFQKLECLDRKISDANSRLDSEKKEQKKIFQDQQDFFLSQIDILNSDYRIQNKHLSEGLNKIEKYISASKQEVSEKVSYQEHKTSIEEQDSENQSLRWTLEKTKNNLQEELYQCIKNISDELERIHDDKQSEYLILQRSIDSLGEKVSYFNEMVNGFTRELTICKKDSHIQEKKIENIYTLIERIQKGNQ